MSLWTTTDPLEEEYPNITTYGFCHNNPVVLVDPDGMGDYYNKAGRWLGNDGRKDNIPISQTLCLKTKLEEIIFKMQMS